MGIGLERVGVGHGAPAAAARGAGCSRQRSKGGRLIPPAGEDSAAAGDPVRAPMGPGSTSGGVVKPGGASGRTALDGRTAAAQHGAAEGDRVVRAAIATSRSGGSPVAQWARFPAANTSCVGSGSCEKLAGWQAGGSGIGCWFEVD